jgi:mRNA interferase RelE/StbE
VSWAYRFDERAIKEIKRLDRQAQKDILAYLDHRVAGNADPRRFGKGLRGNLAGLWRYRVEDYRILCQIKEGHLLVLSFPSGIAKISTNSQRSNVVFV